MVGDISSQRTIDMGCADGVFLPTLSRNFEQVFAIDINPGFVEHCRKLVDCCNLTNVQVLCNKQLSTEELARQIGGGVRILWLLETLEHVGRQPNMWESKVEFLKSCFELVDDDGYIVISVPNMVGIRFLLKYMLQNYILRIRHDRMAMKQLFHSVVFKNTDELEPQWNGGHVGFNHLKLEALLESEFQIVRQKKTAISCLYLIQKPS